jgi:hypothetical protein
MTNKITVNVAVDNNRWNNLAVKSYCCSVPTERLRNRVNSMSVAGSRIHQLLEKGKKQSHSCNLDLWSVPRYVSTYQADEYPVPLPRIMTWQKKKNLFCDYVVD